ncbi:hypothetical protein NMG60_11027102 [Bertholletia excelsa]
MELDFDKYCKVGGSPKTVLPYCRRRSKCERRSVKARPKCANDLFSLDEFTEINFGRYRSVSCNNIKSRNSGLEGNEVLKRGSVYQSSREVRKMKKSGAVEEERRKIELSGKNAFSFSMGIVDSLCSSDGDNLLTDQKRCSVMSLNSELSTSTSTSTANIEPPGKDFLDLSFNCRMSDDFSFSKPSEIPLYSKIIECQSTENVKSVKIENPKFRHEPTISPINDENHLRGRDSDHALPKSLSAKLAVPHSPSPSDSDSSRPSSPKARFTPIRKMFDPFTKSKSQRSPLASAGASSRLPPAGPARMQRNNTLQKSLLYDFSNVPWSSEFGSQFVKNNVCNSDVSCSPAHLHGCLKLETKHGVPFFELSQKFPEDVFVAKTWKAENALNWTYTFHNLHNRRKSNASGRGFKDLNKESSLVGQMQVSCYLCTELKGAGAFDNSMVTEFVLYDVAHAKQSLSAQGNPDQSPSVAKPRDISNQCLVGGCDLENIPDQSKTSLQAKHGTGNGHFDSSHPWAPIDLHPSHEIAATIIRVPFEKRESLKFIGGDEKSDRSRSNLLDLSVAERRNEGVSDCLSSLRINVVIPSGNHGFPSTSETQGPSRLLDRWRLGGGCDCGGWDMACPLTIFSNPNFHNAEDHLLIKDRQPWELFAQGAKENTPALTMRVIEEGRYSVDFHAKLSTLQAFSICISILHSTEASSAFRQERDKQLLECSSLRVFIEEEVKNLIKAVSDEEKRKAGKKIEEISQSFRLNPPFSPISRV